MMTKTPPLGVEPAPFFETERKTMEHQFSDEARREWFADKEAKRDAVLKALATETDPRMQRRLRASARRYKAIIVMGPERTKAASSHPHYDRPEPYPTGAVERQG